jgi:hypothetical protein
MMGYRKNLLKLCGEYLGRPLVHIYSWFTANFLMVLSTLLLTYYFKVVKSLYYVIVDQFPSWIMPRFLKYWYFKDWINIYKVIIYFWFLKFVSTGNATYRLSETILNAWNKGGGGIYIHIYIVGAFCDLTKAFNCVNH